MLCNSTTLLCETMTNAQVTIQIKHQIRSKSSNACYDIPPWSVAPSMPRVLERDLIDGDLAAFILLGLRNNDTEDAILHASCNCICIDAILKLELAVVVT